MLAILYPDYLLTYKMLRYLPTLIDVSGKDSILYCTKAENENANPAKIPPSVNFCNGLGMPILLNRG